MGYRRGEGGREDCNRRRKRRGQYVKKDSRIRRKEQEDCDCSKTAREGGRRTAGEGGTRHWTASEERRDQEARANFFLRMSLPTSKRIL
jgi:hypothetical protein